MATNRYNDPKGRMDIKQVSIRTVDQALFDYFDKKLSLRVNTRIDSNEESKKVPIVFAAGERWKIVRNIAKKRKIRDENGTLILPIISIGRGEIDRTPGFGGMAQECKEIVVSKIIHPKSSNLQNNVYTRKKLGFPELTRKPIFEHTTIPFPDFCTIYYNVEIWTQYQTQMNEILEKIFYAYDHMDSFVMPSEYDGNNPKGDSYYFVGFREGTISNNSNVEEFTDQERIIKNNYMIKVPAYLILDPESEALSYGGGNKNLKVLHKRQSANDVVLKEQILTAEEFEEKFGK